MFEDEEVDFGRHLTLGPPQHRANPQSPDVVRVFKPKLH